MKNILTRIINIRSSIFRRKLLLEKLKKPNHNRFKEVQMPYVRRRFV